MVTHRDRTATIALTPNQYRVLVVIEKLLRKNPWAPSVREIAEEAQIATSNAHRYMDQLESRGWIRRAPNPVGDRKEPRSVEMLKPIPERKSGR